MTPQELTARMTELAQRAARLPQNDPALQALLAELQALSHILPTAADGESMDDDAQDPFDNMPV